MNTIGTVIQVEINRDSLKNAVFKQISDSADNGSTDFAFISKASKKSIENYIDDSKEPDIEIARNVWRNLLMDAIALLKINDSREKIYTDSKVNFTELLINFENIRKTSTYGIDEIDNYFDDFIKFESVLYGLDKHYRDHINHVLQVWAIGIGLIDHVDGDGIQLNDEYIIDKKNDFHFQIENNKQLEITISKSEFWAMWTVIALCHDLGYPIEKTSQINKQAKNIITHFGNMQFTELDYSFSILNTFLVEKFLNIISSKVVKLENSEEYQTKIQTKYRDKFSKSLEDYKHGIFSSLLLFKNLTYFLETDYSINNNPLDVKDAKQFYIRKEILRSIASHTCPKLYHKKFNTLSFLLILCDELQEWNRPKFNNFISRSNNDDNLIVEIKEFSLKTPQKIHILMNYKKINSNSIDEKKTTDVEKHLVINRYKNIHYLLRSAKNEDERNIVFIWGIKFKDIDYNLSFNTTTTDFDTLIVTKTIKLHNQSEKPLELKIDLYDDIYKDSKL